MEHCNGERFSLARETKQIVDHLVERLGRVYVYGSGRFFVAPIQLEHEFDHTGKQFRLALATASLGQTRPCRISHQVKAAISWRKESRPMGPRARAWACHAFMSKAPPSRRRASWRASSQTRSPTLYEMACPGRPR